MPRQTENVYRSIKTQPHGWVFAFKHSVLQQYGELLTAKSFKRFDKAIHLVIGADGDAQEVVE